MPRSNPSRDEDERVLDMLHVIEVSGPAVARKRFKLTSGQVAGMRWRFLRPDVVGSCKCRRKANRDGGMPERWWAAEARDGQRRRAMGKRSAFQRRSQDAYDTPDAAVLPLVPHLAPGATFVEPCAGVGQLSASLRRRGFDCVFQCDIAPRDDSVRRDADPIMRQSGLDLGWAATCADYIITNPPWSRDILHRMIEVFSDLRPTWLLFDADWIHTRQAVPFLWRLRRIVSVGRVKWIEGSKGCGKDNCAWHLFDASGVGPAEFYGRV